MKSTRLVRALSALAAIAALAPAASAEVIFSEALLSQHDATTALNIQNDGTLLRAIYYGNNNLGGAGWRWGGDPAELPGAAQVTVNEITFDRGTDGTAITDPYLTSVAGAPLALLMEQDGPANDYGMLIAAIAFGAAVQDWTPNLDIPGLTVGTTYRLQLLTQVGGDAGGAYTGTVEGEPFSTSGGVSDVHYVLAAEWTATDDTLNLAIDSSKAKIHGYTLHAMGAASFFALTIAPDGSDLDFGWASQAGMLYRLKSSADLGIDFSSWDLVAEDLPATAPLGTTTIPKPGDARLFYRMEEYPAPPVTVFSENFDLASAPTLPAGWDSGAYAGDAGTTAWILGIPTGAATGPSAAFSPDNCVGTNIAGDYLIDANIWLRTPAIDLTGETGAQVVFKEWVDIDDFNLLDIGTVRVLDADDLPTVNVLAVVAANIQGLDPAGWVELSADIPNALGNIVVEFLFESDSDPTEDSSGWYIDDVAVTVDP